MTSFLQDRVCCSGQFSIGGLRFAAGGRILGDQVSTHKLATCQLFYTLLLFFTFNSQTGLLRDPLKWGGLTCSPAVPFQGPGFVFPVIPPQASLVGLPEKTNPTLSRRAGFWVAEREGFEPSIPFRGIHTFQACSFNHSDTSPCLIREDKTTHLQVKSSRKRE